MLLALYVSILFHFKLNIYFPMLSRLEVLSYRSHLGVADVSVLFMQLKSFDLEELDKKHLTLF